MSLKLVFNDFADWSSAAGIPQIAYAFNKIVRAIWFVIWIGLFAMTIYQFYLIVSKFLSYPMTVVTTLEYGAQDFPVVTFCNNNPMIYSQVQNGSTYSKIADLMDQYQEMVNNKYGTISGDTYGLNTPKTRYEKTEWATEALVLLMQQLTPAQKARAMYKFNDVIKVCSFNGIECSEANFTSYYDATYGRCFQFNSQESDSNYRTLRAGSGFGLTVLMLLNQFDPDGNDLFLPTTSVAGGRVGINLKGEDPAMESYGINVPVGQETMIGLEFAKIKRIKKPYSNCIDNDDRSKKFYPDNTYTLNTCFRTCIQLKTINTIGCADPRYGSDGTAPYCVPAQLEALRNLRDNQNPNSPNFFDPLKECDCNPACSETAIDTTISLARFPMDDYAVLNSEDATQEYSCTRLVKFSKEVDCIKWYADNSAVINVFFDGLDYNSYVETPAYPISQALNELGGQMGFWLGVSIISLIEFIGLAVVLCMWVIHGRNVKIGPSDDELANDDRIKHVRSLRDELDAHDHIDAKLRHRAQMRQAEASATGD